MKKYLLIGMCLPVLMACGNTGLTDNPADSAGDYALEDDTFHGLAKEKFVTMTDTEILEETGIAEIPPPPPPETEDIRKLIKTASLSVEVENLEGASQTLDSLLNSHQAYISQDEFQNHPNRKNRNLTIRVPSGQLDALVTRLSSLGIFLSHRSVNVRDVSDVYTDTQLRLKSKRAVLDQYFKLLDRADKMEDILKIEKEIRILREEIEAKEGQLRYLTDQVSLGTIHLDMYQDIVRENVAPSDSFWRKAGDRLVFGWDLIRNISLVMIALWPLWILSGLVWIVVRMWKRKKRMTA